VQYSVWCIIGYELPRRTIRVFFLFSGLVLKSIYGDAIENRGSSGGRVVLYFNISLSIFFGNKNYCNFNSFIPTSNNVPI